MGLIHDPNTRTWKPGDLVIHDSDAKRTDTEMAFRGFDDYISKYRRVLDYFDATKIGLTATPALHTTEIFGAPVYSYTYREAVVDGFLVDYEPPIQLYTELSTHGMTWHVGEDVKVYDVTKNQIDLFKAPDEIKLQVEDFNRKVITRPFNEAVCQYLAQELDPSGRRKTLIFCVSSSHADLVVEVLKKAFETQYGSVEDDAVIKITGDADKPLELIRRYKNERLPNVAVTVDLLTTGIDVPEICNLVFLRQVNSRILFDQMLGRATRLCDFDGEAKDNFRVIDAVRVFENIGKLQTVKHIARRADEMARGTVDTQTRAMEEAARLVFRNEIGPTLQRVTLPLQDVAALARKVARPWEGWLLHAATAVLASAISWAMAAWLWLR